ncbi:RNA-binding domain-containing protein [Auriscalpium vulgare]|uniref:RNA-binding domain-containing protein n=1 Tax=Auriscalpium vulgare TaxID=40419 RepID=A0ACB8RYF7_9AGAM|nr:RNA-binding domain-containing protein [Auriscalpium vulgare]
MSAVKLGKRKDRDEAELHDKHGSTLFVSNLPYTATSTDLQTLFSDIAPVRSAFVVQEHGTGVSKGVGYVSFAVQEDAQSAFDTIATDGIALNGRGLRVSWATQKPTRKERAADANSQPPREAPRVVHARIPAAHAPRDPLAIRTVVVSGLPSSIDAKTIWKKVRKLQGAEKVEWPVKKDDGSEDSSTTHTLFSTPAAAEAAVSKLHAHVFKGSLLSASLKKRLDNVAKVSKGVTPGSSKGKDVASTAMPSRANRVIVRNLPFDITEQDLRAVFLPYGPVFSITIPQKPDPAPSTKEEADGDDDVKMEDAEPRTMPKALGKGYAFVWMWSKKDAEKAIEGATGTKVRTGYAAGMVVDKQKKKKELREEKKLKLKAQGAGEGEAGEEVSGERVIAVDWALSKDKWEEEKKKLADAESEAESDSGEDASSDEDEGIATDDEGSALGLHDHDDDGPEDDEDDEEADRSDDDEPTKPTLPPPEAGTTLFVRNIPFEATEDELRTLFRVFGPLRYARITMDPVMERSRGTGFACFWNKEDADKAVDQSEILRTETMGQTSAPKKNPFTMPSILTPDPSALSAQSLVLHGRTLDVVRAVTREEAGKLKEEGEKAREKADKRNMYLLREGVILPNSSAAATLPEVELEKRSNSFNARRTLLRSNPALYISKTRLSIRQLPTFATERMVKRLAIHAIRTFKAEVRDGARQDLTVDEKTSSTAPPDDAQAAAEKSKAAKDKKSGSGRPTAVKQSKIVRQQDKVDTVTGKGRSKGYGFLELHTHADALRVLRWANNNSAVGALFEEWWKAELRDLLKAEKAKKGEDAETRVKRIQEELASEARKAKGTLIVEFSIENVQVVQRRAAHQRSAKPSDKDKVKPRERLTLPTAVSEDRRPRDSRPQKKQKLVSDPPSTNDIKQETQATRLGAIIGRKRKERKGKSGGR